MVDPHSVCVSLLPTCVLSRFRALRIAIIDHAIVITAHDDKAWMSKDPAPGFFHPWGNDRQTVAPFSSCEGRDSTCMHREGRGGGGGVEAAPHEVNKHKGEKSDYGASPPCVWSRDALYFVPINQYWYNTFMYKPLSYHCERTCQEELSLHVCGVHSDLYCFNFHGILTLSDYRRT